MAAIMRRIVRKPPGTRFWFRANRTLFTDLSTIVRCNTVSLPAGHEIDSIEGTPSLQ